MKKFVYSLAFASAALLLHGCQKEVLSDAALESEGLYKAQGNTAVLSTTMGCDNIGFENASGLLTQVFSDGGMGPIAITSFNSRFPKEPVAARVFDSSNPDKEDVDLGTPNEGYFIAPGVRGPGQGWGGSTGQPATTNAVALGNLLIIQNFDVSVPNDDDVSSQITFNFSSIGKVTVKSITVIDAETWPTSEFGGEAEGGTIKLYTHKGGTELFSTPIPNTNQNGVLVIPLAKDPSVGTANVGYMEITFVGSMGFDNLSFCAQKRYSPCTYTQGYWKNHGEAWPVQELTIGGITYSKTALLSFFRMPVKGNGLISMGHQLVAAMLNVANGADGSAIHQTIWEANELIHSNGLNLTTGFLHPSKTTSLNDKLDQYNNGIIGPGHCK